MSLLYIPSELILYTIENYYYRPNSLMLVNREMNNLLKNHMEKEHKIYLYIQSCKKTGKAWISSLFTCVRTIEQCDLVCLIITRLFDDNEFSKRIRYTIHNSLQVQTEIWYKYITMYK